MTNHKVSDKLISNAEYLKFVQDDGYKREEFWSRDGWNWASGSNSLYPKFWVQNNSEDGPLEYEDFTLRLTFVETEQMPWDLPVEVNCYEASAYCRWLTKKSGRAIRLPTEDEYYSMLKHIDYKYKLEKPNIGLGYASPTPVDKFQVGGIYDPMGNVW